ncbi:preprotein translocase subunit SecD [Burkholderia sp. ST111]|nr:preprotein translocase subunit SecD [Burkholderia sp. ST111]
MRADQILPDHVDQVDFNGTTVRKGTVAAFLASARIWTDEGASEEARAHAEADIVEGLPALRAIGLFEVLEIRDVSLRNWLGTH